MIYFSSLAHFTDCLALTPKFSPHEFLNNICSGFYLHFTFFLSKILMTVFFIAPFFTIFCPSVFCSYFTLQMTPPIPILAHYTPLVGLYTVLHTHMLFSRFCTLLCALVTVDTAYT